MGLIESIVSVPILIFLGAIAYYPARFTYFAFQPYSKEIRKIYDAFNDDNAKFNATISILILGVLTFYLATFLYPAYKLSLTEDLPLFIQNGGFNVFTTAILTGLVGGMLHSIIEKVLLS